MVKYLAWGAIFRLILVALAALTFQHLLVLLPLHWNLAPAQVLSLRELTAWGRKVPGPLRCLVYGPEGHRRVRAALGVLEALRLSRPDTEVAWRDPGRSGPIPGLERRARLGEVLLAAGGRQALAPDASLRSLCGALRGLADPRSREIRFLAEEVRPGAPTGYLRAAAALASELGATCLAGPPDPEARLWIWIGGHSPDLDEAHVQAHLEAGGALLVLVEGGLPEGVAGALARRGIKLGEGYLLDDEPGPRRGRATLRVRTLGGGLEPALLAGARVLEVAAARERRPLETVAAHEVDLGQDPDSGGLRRPRRRGELPAVTTEIGPGWLGVVGDSGFATKAGLSQGASRQLLVELASLGMDRLLGLPGETLVPTGGVDPDLQPESFRLLAMVLLIGLPGLPLGIALVCWRRRRSMGGRVLPEEATKSKSGA
jgi:hypothetical protein